jgi:hypothetical protein
MDAICSSETSDDCQRTTKNSTLHYISVTAAGHRKVLLLLVATRRTR